MEVGVDNLVLQKTSRSRSPTLLERSEIQACSREACCQETVEEILFLLSFLKLTQKTEKLHFFLFFFNEIETIYQEGIEIYFPNLI